jgi:nitrate/nitrite-specific signal transduction histidine kinase
VGKDNPKTLQALHDENAMLSRAVEELSILNDLARAVAGHSDLREILNTIVHRSLRALRAGQGVITLVDESRSNTAKTFVRMVVRSSEKKEFHFNEGLLGWMQLHKKPLLLNNPRTDPDFKRIPWDEPVKSLLCAPMMVKGKLTGVLTVYNAEGREFTHDDERLLSIIAAHMAQVVENARLNEEKRSMQLQIASDLHDDVASSLSSIALYAESLKRQLGNVSRQALETIEKMSSLSLEAVDTMGDIVWSIAPEHDTLNELLFRMKNHALELCSAKEMRTELRIPEEISDRALAADVRRNIFLIFKEALNNVMNHSQARCVSIIVRINGGDFEMMIKDDGIGFSKDSGSRAGGGHGLRNMEKRAREIHATLTLQSGEGKGTTVKLVKKMT